MDVRINDRITAHFVKVLDDSGFIGDMSLSKAKALAKERNLDLIEISPNASPPICKIMEFGKFKYEQAKKEKASKKNQQQIKVKELYFHPNTDQHDIDTKVRHAKEFLEDGHKVKLVMQYRGREVVNFSVGEQKFANIIDSLRDVSTVDSPQTKLEDKQIAIVLRKK